MGIRQRFRYKGIDQQGVRRQGITRARSERDLEQRMRALNVDLIAIVPVAESRTSGRFQRFNDDMLMAFTLQLQQLLSAGVPLMDILAEQSESAEPLVTRELIAQIFQRMVDGCELSVALGEYPQYFDSVYLQLVKVGEQSGRLPQVLEQIVEMKKGQQALQRKTRKILSYPIILFVVLMAVTLFMLKYVLPEITQLVADLGGELNMMTDALLSVAHLGQEYGAVVVVTGVVFAFMFKWLVQKNERIRLGWHHLVLCLPWVGPLIKKVRLARIASTLAVMYGAGIPLNQCLKMSAAVAGNFALQRAVEQVEDAISNGSSIHEAFALTELFPPLMIRMIKVGEQSGSMETTMLQVGQLYGEEVRQSIEQIEPLLEPILTLVMALFVGWIMLAILSPVYDIFTRI